MEKLIMKQSNRDLFKIIILIAGIGSIVYPQVSDIGLTIGNVDEQHGTFDILYDASTEFFSFQLNIQGVTILDATSEIGYDIIDFNSDDGDLIALIIGGEGIPAGQGVAASIVYELSPDVENICIENAIVSGSGFPATELETSIGDCFAIQWNGILLDFDNLHIDEISGNTERVIDIRYSSYQQIAGFQILFDGVTINDVVSEYLTIIHTTNSI
ncbi:uncharacterized protein METZ01_LOCUS478972, partial [marine metagenome]